MDDFEVSGNLQCSFQMFDKLMIVNMHNTLDIQENM